MLVSVVGLGVGVIQVVGWTVAVEQYKLDEY